jgi:predicted outer membrane repeat protein
MLMGAWLDKHVSHSESLWTEKGHFVPRCQLRRTTLADNTATFGGGISAENSSTLALDSSTLQLNNASDSGGALLTMDEAHVSMPNTPATMLAL